jgi:hypothetical protein
MIIDKKRNTIDKIGFSSIVTLFILNAFHFVVSEEYPLYREYFGILFIILSGTYLIRKIVHREDGLKINRLIYFIIIYPILLLAWTLFDSGEYLYGKYYAEAASLHIGKAPLYLYIIRNSVLYLPMVIYMYLRGINIKEIQVISFIAIIIAPMSIQSYLNSGEFENKGITIGGTAELGGKGIAYNSYVPYLTFPILCGIHLLFSKINMIVKYIVLISIIITGIFILLSTSRQSVLFVFFILIIYFIISRTERKKINKIYIYIFIITGGIMAFNYLTSGYVFNQEYNDRYSGIREFFGNNTEGRLDKAIEGITLLKPLQWVIGAGLTSVITGGPHNDYIRWTQRVGAPIMLIGFYPFYSAFYKSLLFIKENRTNNSLYIYLTLIIGFTLYHSFFGYPREDANQAIAVYLGFGIWIGAYREGLLNENK